MDQIEQILENQEKIVWQDQVNRKALNVICFFFLLIIVGGSYFFFRQETIDYTSNGVEKTMNGSTFGWIILIGLTLILALIYAGMAVKRFAITNKRVIIKSGIIGTDYKSIYFDQIKTVVVDVGIIGKIFKVGTVKIDTGKIKIDSHRTGSNDNIQMQTSSQIDYDKLSLINKPYEVYKNLQLSLSERKESLYSGRADKKNN